MAADQSLPITIEDVRAAARRLRGAAVRTPLLESSQINALVGGRVFIKPENLQRTGSFKFRGAYNRLVQLTAEERARGVVAFSSGNHAQGVAHAAELLGISATIVMPADAPAIKRRNTEAYGATVVAYDRFKESREEIAVRLAEDSGATLVPSFDDVYIMAGQGTAGLEVADDLTAQGVKPGAALFCCGGGGLSSGSFTALKDAFPNMQAYTVEPAGFDDTARSLKSGVQERIDGSARSVCDALLSPMPGAMPLAVLGHLGAEGLVVSDEEAEEAMRVAFECLKLVVEPGGAVALAAILSGKINLDGGNAVVVLSGGNVDPAFFARVLAS